MKTKKRISLLLVICLCLTMMPATALAAQSGDGTYTWPVDTKYGISNPYNKETGHNGVDFPAPIGSNVYAVAGGTVIVATDYGCTGSHYEVANGWCQHGDNCLAKINKPPYGSYANWIIIDHENGTYSLYAHLQTGSFQVAVGSRVEQGQLIARSGNAGKTKSRTSNGAHLHFELRVSKTSDKNAKDPAKELTKVNVNPVYPTDPTDPTEPVPVSNNPQGYLDDMSGGLGSIYLKCWAFDADDLNAALEIQLRRNGQVIGSVLANGERTDVDNRHHCGTHHGFDGMVPIDRSLSGVMDVEVWAVNIGGGNDSYLGTRTVEVITDQTPPVITDVVISDVSSSGYTVSCTVTDNNVVDRVLFPTWTVLNDQDDLPDVWGRGTQNGNTFTYRVNTEDHNGESGAYVTHIYAYDASGNYDVESAVLDVPPKDSTAPVISDTHVYNITPDGYTVSCKVTDNVGVTRVQFPTWTTTNDQDDLVSNWETNSAVSGTRNGSYYTFRVSSADHNGETTAYATHIYAYDADGNVTKADLGIRDLATVVDTEAPVISDIQIIDLSAFGYTVICTVTDDQGVNRVQMPTWTAENGQDEIQENWSISAAARASGTEDSYVYRVNVSAHNKESGVYVTEIYAYDHAGNVAKVSVNGTLGTIEVPENLPLAEGLKDDFYSVVENNVTRTVLTRTDDAVFSSNQGLDSQLWHFVRNDDGTFTIHNAADENQVLDIHLAQDSVDANVQVHTANGSLAQRWYIHNYNGLYYLRPACSAKLLLDLPYVNSADGVAARINNPNLGGGEGFNLLGDILMTYSVTYDANGGTGAPEQQHKTAGQALWISEQIPAMAGRKFLGWAESSNADTAYYMPGQIYTEDADLYLYAVWEDTVVASGWSGATQWTLASDGVLTFSGTGNMKNYGYNGGQPWLNKGVDITSVVIEDGVVSVGSGAFRNLTTLKSVTFPETTLTKMGEAAFYGSGLESVEIPASLWTIQPYTFKNCTNLTSVKFHEGNLQKISDGAFYGTGLTELVLPDCLDIMDVYAFKGCEKLTSITIGSGLTELREAVFYGTAIPTIEIPEGITKIGPYAFKNCVELESIGLPSTLTSVGEASFYDCTALKAIDLPDAVTSVGNYAFRRCTGLTSADFGENLVTIGECSFYGCTGLTELVIPDKVTTIKPYAFKTCTGLTSVTLGSKVATIGEGAFNTCTGLKTIVFPASLKTIGDYCFSGSYNLWKLSFEGDAPSIGTGAFKGLVATAFYPGSNTSWTSDLMQNYGGKITWKSN